ncbi:MAG: hypothetical protein K6G88_11875 [Lachnospiraceae bacterium]|nr:hypothetical protein [Lachnospiraceae bacterium]
MVSKIKSLPKKRMALYLLAILIPILLRTAFDYYEQRFCFGLEQVAIVTAIYFGILGITIFISSCFNDAEQMWLIKRNSISWCVVLSMVILGIVILGSVINVENYFSLSSRRSIGFFPLFTIIPISILMTFWLDAIRYSNTKNSPLLGAIMMLLVHFALLYLFKTSTFVVLEMTIMVTSFLVFIAWKNIAKEHRLKRWTVWVTAGMYFILSNMFLVAIKLVNYGKLYGISYYERYREWNMELFKNAKPVGQLQSATFNINDTAVYNYKNLLHNMLFEKGWLLASIYLVISALFILIILRMISPGFNTNKRISYLPGCACGTYFVLKSILAVLFSFGVSPAPVHFLFARKSTLDVIALGIIIYSFYMVNKAEKDDQEVEKNKLMFTDNLFNTGEKTKLKVIERNFVDGNLITLTVINEKESPVTKHDFMMAGELTFNGEIYYIVCLFEDLDSIVVLKSIDDEEYSYETVNKSVQSEVFIEYQHRMRELYV